MERKDKYENLIVEYVVRNWVDSQQYYAYVRPDNGCGYFSDKQKARRFRTILLKSEEYKPENLTVFRVATAITEEKI